MAVISDKLTRECTNAVNYLRKSLIYLTPVARLLQELKFLLVILVARSSDSFAKRCTISDRHYCSYLQACGLLRRHVSVRVENCRFAYAII